MKTIKEVLSESVDLEKHDFKLNNGHSLENVNGLNEWVMPVLQAALGGLRTLAARTAVRAANGIKGAVQYGLSTDADGQTRLTNALNHNQQYRMNKLQAQQVQQQMQQQNSMPPQ